MSACTLYRSHGLILILAYHGVLDRVKDMVMNVQKVKYSNFNVVFCMLFVSQVTVTQREVLQEAF